ncbi:uncharacterized protein RHTO_07395 [Rhodotorula toruloides NP11]|uniref:Uncharacterized protein n=1 Tax=Rhodotorula toruloides (strain NP11) TaxID=1130832 RepID=M7WCG6_RHOT1|nr:uncharacterized protein RHTO_07395 [Rhodotorula toruloides NP11]EMS18067.1 hypothetical protein RHTO_07395 [Rhodotorula toruloides NP11]
MDELPKDFPVPFEEATRTVYRSHNGSLVPAFRLDSILPDYTAAAASRAFDASPPQPVFTQPAPASAPSPIVIAQPNAPTQTAPLFPAPSPSPAPAPAPAPAPDPPARTLAPSTRSSEMGWPAFSPFEARGGREIRGLVVELLPEPQTEAEQAEAGAEWAARALDDGETRAAYERMQAYNAEALGAHHVLPTYPVFRSLAPHLPEWVRRFDGMLPRWRSPLDRELVAGEIAKPFRYTYLWHVEMSAEAAGELVDGLNTSHIASLAESKGVLHSFLLCVTALTDKLDAIFDIDEEPTSIRLSLYVGWGAGSELQLNNEVRPLGHLADPASLFSVLLHALQPVQSAYPPGDVQLFLTFVTALPSSVYPYSRSVTMASEVTNAVASGAASTAGAANAISCGPVVPSQLLISYLSQLKPDQPLDPNTLPKRRPLSLRALALDKGLSRRVETTGQLTVEMMTRPSGGGGEEAVEDDDGGAEESDARQRRLEMMREEEERLKEADKRDFGMELWAAREEDSSAASLTAKQRLWSTVMSTYRIASAGATTQPTDDISSKSKQNMSLDELIEIRYGCLNASTAQLDNLLQTHFPHLVARVQGANLRLDTYRDLVHALLSRHHHAGRRTTNLFLPNELATTGSPFTAKTVREVSVHHTGNPRLAIRGVAVSRTGEVHQLRAVAFVAALPEDTQFDFVLRWSQDGQVLQLLHDGEVVRYGYEGRKGREWSKEDLRKSNMRVFLSLVP